jgi:hypothetical protein
MRRILFLLLVLSTIVYPLAARAQAYLVVSACGTLPQPSPLGSASGPIAIDRNGNLCSGVTVSVPPVSVATPLAINIPQIGAVVAGAYADGSIFSIGAVADAIYTGSGSATVISALKGIYAAVKSISVTANVSIPTPLVVSLANTPGVTQATSPWVVSPSVVQPVQGTVIAYQGTSPWNVNSSPVTIATPLAVGLVNTPGVTQATSPWIVSGTSLQGTTPWVVSPSTLQGVFGSATVYQGTSPWTVSANSLQGIFGSVTAYQGTSPWTVSANSISPIQGTVIAYQGTSPWNVNSSPIQIATPLAVGLVNTPGVTQATSPWIVSGTVLQGTSPWVVSANSVSPVQGTVIAYQGTSPWNVNSSPIQIATPLAVGLVNTPGVTQATTPWIVQGNGPNTQVLAVTVTPAITAQVSIPTPLAVTLTNTPGVTQATTPWIVSGTVLQGTTPWTVSANALQGVFGSATVYQGTSPWTVSANSISPVQGTVIAYQGTSPWNVNSSPVQIATPLQVGVVNTIGVTQATTPWIVSGTVLQGTSPWTVSASALQGVFGSATVYQGTSPWTVSANSISPVQGTVTALQGTSPWTVTGTSLQGTSPWIVSGTVLQGTTPWTVSASTIQGVFGSATVYQGTSPWTVSANSVQPIQGNVTAYQGTSPWTVTGTSLQGTNPWTIQPNAASTMRVNPLTPSQWGLGVESAAVPVTSMMVGTVASGSESPTQGSFTVQNLFADLVGKLITSPYANRENYVSGTVSTSGNTLAVLIATPTGGVRYWITDLQCTRNDAGTTAIVVSVNNVDTSGVQGANGWTVPNSGGGGGFIKSFQVPLKIAASTALQIKNLSSGVTSLLCSATGYSGY